MLTSVVVISGSGGISADIMLLVFTLILGAAMCVFWLGPNQKGVSLTTAKVENEEDMPQPQLPLRTAEVEQKRDMPALQVSLATAEVEHEKDMPVPQVTLTTAEVESQKDMPAPQVALTTPERTQVTQATAKQLSPSEGVWGAFRSLCRSE